MLIGGYWLGLCHFSLFSVSSVVNLAERMATIFGIAISAFLDCPLGSATASAQAQHGVHNTLSTLRPVCMAGNRQEVRMSLIHSVCKVNLFCKHGWNTGTARAAGRLEGCGVQRTS